MFDYSKIVARAKHVGIFATAFGVILTGWVALSLPVPASVAELDRRDARFGEQMRALTILVLEGHRELYETRKDLLNSQKFALERLPQNEWSTVQMGRISDNMKLLDKRDEEARERIDKLKGVK